MNWKNDGIWLLLLPLSLGFFYTLGITISSDIVSLLLLAIVVILIIIVRRKKKHTHKE